jgi:hypothetical protein
MYLPTRLLDSGKHQAASVTSVAALDRFRDHDKRRAFDQRHERDRDEKAFFNAVIEM